MHILNNNIKEGEFIKNRKRYQELSPQVKDLIEGLLCKDVDKRLKVQEALNHPWISSAADQRISDDSESSNSSLADDQWETRALNNDINLNYQMLGVPWP